MKNNKILFKITFLEIKSNVSDKRNKDIDLFNRFKEYSRIHPETTYEQFLTKTL